MPTVQHWRCPVLQRVPRKVADCILLPGKLFRILLPYRPPNRSILYEAASFQVPTALFPLHCGPLPVCSPLSFSTFHFLLFDCRHARRFGPNRPAWLSVQNIENQLRFSRVRPTANPKIFLDLHFVSPPLQFRFTSDFCRWLRFFLPLESPVSSCCLAVLSTRNTHRKSEIRSEF